MPRGSRLALSCVGAAVLATAVVVARGARNLTPAVRDAREAGPIKAITTIHTAQVQFYSSYNRFAASMQELGPPASGAEGPSAAGLIERDLASGEKTGYKFTLQATPSGYTVIAIPIQATNSRSRTYFSDQSMKIHQHSGPEPASAKDPWMGD